MFFTSLVAAVCHINNVLVDVICDNKSETLFTCINERVDQFKKVNGFCKCPPISKISSGVVTIEDQDYKVEYCQWRKISDF